MGVRLVMIQGGGGGDVGAPVLHHAQPGRRAGIRVFSTKLPEPRDRGLRIIANRK